MSCEHDSRDRGHDPDHPPHDHEPGPWDDETAEWYVEKWGDHPSNRMAVEIARLAADDVLVDIGCGSGEAVREAAARLPHGRAIGVDPTPAMIHFAHLLSASHPNLDRMEFHEAPAEELPLPDASATVVLALNSLHHWVDPRSGLAEVLRILKPGGRFLLVDEETAEGRWGHGEEPLTDSTAIVEFIRDAGLAAVETSRHVEDDVVLLAAIAHKVIA